jgi:threonine dehydrogenase-like Zn-dependent dehydrogenase
MKATIWCGKRNMKVENVPDPTIVNPRDAIVRVTSTAICGSDLHLYNGFNPTMRAGDILGHEFMGEIVAIGSACADRKVGDRVVVAFPIACGNCFFCRRELFSCCENSNPNAWMAEKVWGHSCAGIFGYSHLLGGYPGGQAELVRVPYADVGTLKIPDGIPDERVLFLSDIFPTGYMAAEFCKIQPDDVIAVWGCGPVGLLAMKSAFLLGAKRVIAIDRFPYRLAMARDKVGAETIDYEETDVLDALAEMTGGLGPDACIDAVGLEAHTPGPIHMYDRAKQAIGAQPDRPHALRQAILACRKGGTVSIPGVYSAFVDKIPMGAVVNKGLTLKSSQTPVQHYWGPLLDRIRRGEIDPGFITTHTLPLDEAARGYDIFCDKEDRCVKVVLKP